MQDRAHTPADSALNALLGRGSEFDGKLSFEGTVRIDGTFTGEISTNDMLIIGRAHVCSSHANISYAVFCLKKKKTEPKDNKAHATKHIPNAALETSADRMY